MRLTTRLTALALAAALLVACGHKDKNAPLAFAPADTPYALAKFDALDAATRSAMLAQANAGFPSQLAQLDATADRMSATDADGARLLHALTAEFKGKTIEASAQAIGVNIDGQAALYGIGLVPVARIELSDPKSFEAFIGRLETAYGKKLDTAREGDQAYRRHVFASAGTQVVLATQGKYAVLALLPADTTKPLLRQALGLDRPQKSLQDDGRLSKLAKANGYRKWVVGQLDLARALPLALGGDSPLLKAMHNAKAQAVAAKTGEPVANQLQTAPSCTTEAARIAARVPSMSFGYTRLDAKHQDARLDVALAPDITKAFVGVKVPLPGLDGKDAAPFDLSLALPMATLRGFWTAQAEAVAARPFTCPALLDINDSFARLLPAMQKAGIPPFGDLQGIRLALDTLAPVKDKPIPTFSGRLLVASTNAPGLFALGQATVPSLTQLHPANDGTPLALSPDLTKMIGQPTWLAMTDKVLGLGIGTGENAKLAHDMKSPGGDAGTMARMHLTGTMYVQWLQLMDDKIDTLATAAAAMSRSDTDDDSADSTVDANADAARSKAQLAAMRAQAERIQSIGVQMQVETQGIVITSQTAWK